jgi:hypothetical protein
VDDKVDKRLPNPTPKDFFLLDRVFPEGPSIWDAGNTTADEDSL